MKFPKILACLTAFAGMYLPFATMVGSASPAGASTAETRIVARVTADGTPSFDATDDTGHDSGASNLRVRTFDTISYRVDYQFNGLAGQTKTVSFRSEGGAITEPPPNCATPTFNATRDTLVCTVGSVPDAGSAGSFTIVATVGAVQNNSTVAFSATSSAGSTTSRSEAEPVVATAAPRWDLSTDHSAFMTRHTDNHGIAGYLALLPVTVEADLSVNEGKGVEGLSGDVTFTLNVEAPGHKMPPYRLLAGTSTTYDGATFLGCGPAKLGLDENQPFGAPGIAKNATALNSTDVGGSWSCKQKSEGGPIDVELSGANLAPFTLPTYGSQPMPIFPRKVLVSAQVAVFFSEADVRSELGGDGVLDIEWQATDFDPDGASRTSNYDTDVEPLWNNRGHAAVSTFVSSGGWDSQFENDYQEIRVDHPQFGPGDYFDARPPYLDSNHFLYVPGQSPYYHAGDGTIAGGQTFTQALYRDFDGASGIPDANSIMCAFIDPSTTTVIDMPPIVVREIDSNLGSTFGRTLKNLGTRTEDGPVWAHSSSRSTTSDGRVIPYDDPVKVVVEYGTGPWNAGDTCGDNQSASGWTASPSSTPGATKGEYPAVSMVRIRTLGPIVGTGSISARIALRADDNNEPGAFLRSSTAYGTWTADHGWSGDADAWTHPVYDPAIHDGPGSDVHFGDRLTFATRTLVVTHSVVGDDPGELIPGDIVSFRITGTIFGSVATSVTLAASLPPGLEFVDATVPPTDPAADSSTLQWVWGPTERSISREVTYRARVTASAPNGSTLTSAASGNAPDLSPNGNALNASVTVRTAAGFVQLDVWNSVTAVKVRPGDSYGFTISSRNSANVGLTNIAVIDIFPFQGSPGSSANRAALNRAPSTSYNGSTALAKVDASIGTLVEYTSASPADINDDPRSASNQPRGATRWCTTADFGATDCPDTLRSATAIRITKPALAPDETLTVGLGFKPLHNRTGDRYSNNVTASASEAALLARSEDVSVEVGTSDEPSTTTTTSTVAPSSTAPARANPTTGVPDRLAFTGTQAVWLMLAGSILLVGGTTMLIVRRPKHHRRQ